MVHISIHANGPEKQYLVLNAVPIQLNRIDYGVGTVFRTRADKIFLGELITVNLNGLFKPRNTVEEQLLTEYDDYPLTNDLKRKYVGQYFSESGTAYEVQWMGRELIY